MTALFYIYRNLHKGCFSVRYRGRVIEHCTALRASGVQFKVNQAGRDRVLQERSKNVHAFVAAESYTPLDRCEPGHTEVSYNPYRAASFTARGQPVFSAASVLLTNKKCYLEKSN